MADKGYHGNAMLEALIDEDDYRTYISEPDRGRRHWKDKEDAQRVTYANRRRIRGERGRRLMRRRGELLERPFAHYLEAGGMRRTHLRKHGNILKRLLVHVAGLNLGVLMRNLIGTATPREYADQLGRILEAFVRVFELLGVRPSPTATPPSNRRWDLAWISSRNKNRKSDDVHGVTVYSTGC